MDNVDAKIICNLLEDGRITNAKLSREVGLSESATLERVRRLEASGVISGYTANVEPSQLGRSLEVLMTFTLKNQNSSEVSRFVEAIIQMEEVLSCAQTLGRFDFLAHIAVKNAAALEELINDKLIGLGLIDRMESLTILKMFKRWRSPMPELQKTPARSQS